MTLRREYTPIQPEFDDFLFATVGEEINGMPLTTISMLTRLGLDPWREAGRLASLAKQEAIDQLTLSIARLPGTGWVDERRGEIAGSLINPAVEGEYVDVRRILDSAGRLTKTT